MAHTPHVKHPRVAYLSAGQPGGSANVACPTCHGKRDVMDHPNKKQALELAIPIYQGRTGPGTHHGHGRKITSRKRGL